jgi:uncharacterized membrane protein
LLKIIIVLLLICVILSLMSGLVFLFKDTGKPDSRRLWYALGVRITLLVLAIGYGFYTGELRMGLNAPWHGATQVVPQATDAD